MDIRADLQHLGYGLTRLKSCGEIDIILYRNEHLLRFRAPVAQHLYCTAIGGTTFIKDNNIKQDFNNNIINLLDNTCIIPSTRKEAILPVLQMSAALCLHCVNLQMSAANIPSKVQYGTVHRLTGNSTVHTIPNTVQYGTAHRTIGYSTVHNVMKAPPLIKIKKTTKY